MEKQVLEVVRRKKLDFTVDPSIFDSLLAYQKKLPCNATGSDKQDGMSSYHDPAGLALLGMKNNIIDTVVPLAMSGGCWDAPNINYNDMYKGFSTLLEEEKVCVGMALVRNFRWSTGTTRDDAKIPDILKNQIHGMRKSFDDITKTLWIVIHNGYFRVYRPFIAEEGRVKTKEIQVANLFKNVEQTEFIEKKIARDIIDKKAVLALRKERKLFLEKELAKKKINDAKKALRKMAEERAIDEKKNRINEEMAKEVTDVIKLDDGYVLIKDANNKYILWKEK